MEKFSKFIIEDDKLILMRVTFHKEIAIDLTKVNGGGDFRYLQHTDMFVFSGESHDFGKAKFEDIKKCVANCQVYSNNRLNRNISNKHNFGYDTGAEIIELKTECSNTNIDDLEEQLENLKKRREEIDEQINVAESKRSDMLINVNENNQCLYCGCYIGTHKVNCPTRLGKRIKP